jgi:hypothetical protein
VTQERNVLIMKGQKNEETQGEFRGCSSPFLLALRLPNPTTIAGKVARATPIRAAMYASMTIPSRNE